MIENGNFTRDARGRFLPGRSGNPAGKKPGTRNRATLLREALGDGEDKAAARIVIDKALAGDVVAARFIVGRLQPIPRSRAIALDLPEGATAGDVLAASNATVQAMASGEITPDEALTVTRVLDGRLRALEAAAREKSPSPLAGEGRGEGVVAETGEQLRQPPHPPIAAAMGPSLLSDSRRARKGRGEITGDLLHSTCISRLPALAAAGVPWAAPSRPSALAASFS